MDFELKHKQGARPAGPRVEAIARLSREFKAQAWPDCEDAGMNRCEYSRYVAGEYSYSEPWGDIKGEVLEAHRQRRERARQKAPIQDGYLSVWAEKESWRPEDAFRLVCGVKPLGASHRPINNLAKVPEAYEGLCGSVYIDAEAISKGCEISRVESKWSERLENPAKISPLEFIAWCEKRGIDTTWLSSIKSVPNMPAAPAPAPSASAPAVAAPEPVAAPAEVVPVLGAGRRRTPTVQEAIAPYVAKLMRERPDYTAEALYQRMRRDAGNDGSPLFRSAQGGKLFCVETGKPCGSSTVSAALTDYRKTHRKHRSSTVEAVEAPSNP